MNGELAIDNGGRLGTSMYLSLPFTLTDISHFKGKPIEEDLAKKQIRSLKLLLAKDEEISSFATKMLLENFGHSVTCARNGLEVVQLLSAERFDLIFMDIQMLLMDGKKRQPERYGHRKNWGASRKFRSLQRQPFPWQATEKNFLPLE